MVAFAIAFLVTSCGGTGTVATPTSATSSAPAEVQLMDADNGRSIEVAHGGTVIVALTSNPSTGYAWAVDPSPGPQLKQLGDATYVPAGSTLPVVGAGGTEKFTFSAASPGTVTLHLIYRRSFEPGVAPIRTFEVSVTVR